MISSELKESLNKILPLSQDLIGVAFRRKISYRGHYIEEYVDKNKIHAYFNFFKDYNHLFQDFTFDDTILDNFEKDMMNQINKNFSSPDNEEEEKPDGLDDHVINPGKAQFATNSLILDKYREDQNKNTVANKFAGMVVQIETLHNSHQNDEEVILDPEDEFFEGDADQVSEVDNEEEDEECFLEELTPEDLEIYNDFTVLKKKLEKWVTIDLQEHCKCTTVKILASVVDIQSQLLKIKVENEEFNQCLHDYIAIAFQFKESGYELLQESIDCNHSYNEITTFLKNIVLNKNMSANDIKRYVVEQKKQIDDKLDKISIAPGKNYTRIKKHFIVVNAQLCITKFIDPDIILGIRRARKVAELGIRHISRRKNVSKFISLWNRRIPKFQFSIWSKYGICQLHQIQASINQFKIS